MDHVIKAMFYFLPLLHMTWKQSVLIISIDTTTGCTNLHGLCNLTVNIWDVIPPGAVLHLPPQWSDVTHVTYSIILILKIPLSQEIQSHFCGSPEDDAMAPLSWFSLLPCNSFAPHDELRVAKTDISPSSFGHFCCKGCIRRSILLMEGNNRLY